MKRLLCCTAILVFTNSCFMEPTAEEEISGILTLQQEAWNSGDVVGFMDHYRESADLTFAGESGVTRGHGQVLERYLNKYDTPEKMGTLTFNILEFEQLSDETAYVIGEWSLIRAADNPSGYFTLVWKKINGKWKIIHDHTS